jgi:glycosyltransferase involved in cell wall biosynthesis
LSLTSAGLDATYSVGSELSGVGVYSREILHGLAAAHPECKFLHCARPHRFARLLQESRPPNARARLLAPPLFGAPGQIFHGLNQRLPVGKLPPAVTTFHDLFVLSGDYSTPEFRRRFATQARDAAARSTIVIAVSAFTARQVASLLGVEHDRIRIIYHGVRRRVNPKARHPEKLILFVGALQRRKNIARLISAFERAAPDPWRLVLAGSAGFGAAEELRALEASPARDRIDVTGWIDDARLAALYARASIFAFPSLDEGFGMPILEAMAAGVPVLASNRSAIPEICGGAALLADPFDIDALAGALQWLITDQELARGLSEAGIRRADCFSWENAVSQTWETYAELVG